MRRSDASGLRCQCHIFQNSWRVTVGSPIYSMLRQDSYISHIMHQGHHPIPKKSHPWYLRLGMKRPTGPWFPMSENALQQCLKKQIAGTVTLLIWTRWHEPIHLCLLFDVLEWVEHRDGLSHWRLVWWIKHQCALGQNWIFEYKSRNGYGSQDLLQSVTLLQKLF